ncbi:MAG: Stk1 family PASTA domain-containing Ser/Thr kinase [Solirubrobacteraceae bacterium]
MSTGAGQIRPQTLVDDRYLVLERLGSGGMADVYRAEDQQLGRPVALKLLYRRFAEDPEFVERFRREASAAGGLQHPNVVSVYDRGEWDGTYYIAMEFLEGSSLKHIVVESAPLDPVWAIDVGVQVLRAARFAHKRGIIHRDIKPHNVIVDEDGRAKVTDFGIARAGASDMTETGSIMGTAQYLSPEQAQGHAVSAESDLYSIGIVLYEMLAGRLPFEGDSAVTIALKQVSEPPQPPSVYAEVPADLEAIVLRALEKDPTRRFPDADAFIAALEEVRARIVSGAPAGEATTAFGALPPLTAVTVFDPVAPVLVEEEAAEERRAWPWLLAIALIIVLAGGALAFALTRPGKKVDVPDVTGIELNAAVATLENRGFEADVERVRDDAPQDRVLRQDPGAGDRAEEGSTVRLSVSAGPGQATVPDVKGKTKAQARKLLKQDGFKVRFDTESSEDVAQGRVTRTVPIPGLQAERGSPVTAFVSTGLTQVAVPGVAGEERDSAVSTIEGAGLRAAVQTRETSDSPIDTVLSQNPAAGSQVGTGSTVTIVVAKAPPTVPVPGVVGLGKNAARSRLRSAGLTVSVETVDVRDPDEADVVQEQAPAAGRDVVKGSAVTITVGTLADSEVPPGGGEPPPGE